MVDVSHLSREATLDAIRLSRAPISASHSSIFSIKPDPRNMDDETLLALAAKGGAIQITPVYSSISQAQGQGTRPKRCAPERERQPDRTLPALGDRLAVESKS